MKLIPFKQFQLFRINKNWVKCSVSYLRQQYHFNFPRFWNRAKSNIGMLVDNYSMDLLWIVVSGPSYEYMVISSFCDLALRQLQEGNVRWRHGSAAANHTSRPTVCTSQPTLTQVSLLFMYALCKSNVFE